MSEYAKLEAHLGRKVATSADWSDISERARKNLEYLGGFGPTVRAEDRTIKGYVGSEDNNRMYDKTYFDSKDLREWAADFIEVADWLDKRAEAESLTPNCESKP